MRVSHTFYDIAGSILYNEIPFDIDSDQALRLFLGAKNGQLGCSQTEPPNFKSRLLRKVYCISLGAHDSSTEGYGRGEPVLKYALPALINVRTVHLWDNVCDCDGCQEKSDLCDSGPRTGGCIYLRQLRPRKLVIKRLTPPLLRPHTKKDSLSPMTDTVTVLTIYIDGTELFHCDHKKENDVSLYVLRKNIRELRLLLRLNMFRKDYPEVIRRLVNLIAPILKASCEITIVLLPALQYDPTGSGRRVWEAGNDDIRRAMSALADRTPDRTATLLVKDGADYLKGDVTDELSVHDFQNLRECYERYALASRVTDGSPPTEAELAQTMREPHQIPGYRDYNELFMFSSRESRTCVEGEGREDVVWEKRHNSRAGR